jgi:hypothetical protein
MFKTNQIKENEMGDRMMTGAPYNQGGGLGTSGIDTISSPDISQTPDKFKYPQVAGNQNDISVPVPDDYNPASSVQPASDADINAIKNVVTPDEVISGIQYELKKMTFKRKDVAKQIVISNLKKDPRFYSRLHMMQVDENGIKKEAIYDIIKEMKKRKHIRDL